MELVVNTISWACLLSGAVFCMIGAIGMLRMPDFYTRTHAASVTDTLGAGLILFGLILQAGFTLVAVKLFFIIVFMMLINPGAAHGLVKSAYAQGIKVECDDDEVEEEGDNNAASD